MNMMSDDVNPITYNEIDLEPDLCHTCNSSFDQNVDDEWICCGCGEIIIYDDVEDRWDVIKEGGDCNEDSTGAS
jgi:hypothetical protein